MKRATQIICRFAHLLNISIHALVKRATLGNKGVDMKVIISIHALVKRATVPFALT